jgi:hypothetical protein
MFHPPFFNLWGNIFQVSDFYLWFWRSLYKSAKFQLSTSSRSGLAFLHKDTKEDSVPNFGLWWGGQNFSGF